jgi:biopolymer transport protein ExbD
MNVTSSRKGGRRNSNFELNLVPFIDVLSTCICFLLVTTVFLNLGSFHVNQAIGSPSQEKQKKEGTVSVSMGSKGDVRFEIKDVPGYSGRNNIVTIHGQAGQVSFVEIERFLQSFHSQAKDVKTAMILPNPMTRYDDIIQLMASLKKNSLDEIGIAPL